MLKKQKIYVPQYDGMPVFKTYQGIRSDQYLERAKEAVEKFLHNNQHCLMTIQTSRQGSSRRFLISDSEVSVKDDQIQLRVNGDQHYTVEPSKFGYDQVGDNWNKDRLWLFSQRTLDDINLICEECLGKN